MFVFPDDPDRKPIEKKLPGKEKLANTSLRLTELTVLQPAAFVSVGAEMKAEQTFQMKQIWNNVQLS